MRKKLTLIIVLVLVIIMIIFMLLPKKEISDVKQPTKEELATKEIKSFTNKTFDDGFNLKELEKKFGSETFSDDILIGEESFLREKPAVVRINVDDYLEAQDKYASRVEKQIKDNFDYKMEETVTSVEGIVCVTVLFKSYYYIWYLDELRALQTQLLQMSNYKPVATFDGRSSDETNAVVYKAKIKAMEILDSYLNDYKNENEYFISTIKYDPKSQQNTNDSIRQYYSNLGGLSYPSLERTTEKYQKNIKDRIAKIIETSKHNGILLTDDVLKLK